MMKPLFDLRAGHGKIPDVFRRLGPALALFTAGLGLFANPPPSPAETAEAPQVVVLGYGGTIAGRAEGAFKAEYRAGGFCLRDIVRHLLGAIDEEESDTDLSHPEGSSLVGSELHASSNMCGDRRCMQCWIGAEFCEQGGADCTQSVSCDVQLIAAVESAGVCSCEGDGAGPDNPRGTCYCQTKAEFCDIRRLDSSAMTPSDGLGLPRTCNPGSTWMRSMA